MKKLLLLIFLGLIFSNGYSQYPIKTIFKGDSVIILTVEQSDKINSIIEKNTGSIRDLSRKNKEYEEEIRRANIVIAQQNYYIDSLSNVLLEYIKKDDEQNALVDSIWRWSLGPSLIYTEYPDDSTVYVMDLSHYYMTTDDFGIIMVKMSEKEYKKYLGFTKEYGMSERAFWEFRSNIRIKKLPPKNQEERRVWKFRRDWDRKRKNKEK